MSSDPLRAPPSTSHRRSELSPAPVVVLVHGAWHDSWCWKPVGEVLAARGVPWCAPDLPLRSLREDAAVLRRMLVGLDRPSLIVAHSRGARVAAFASWQVEPVRHVVFVASDVPLAGRADFDDETPTPLSRQAIIVDPDGFSRIDPCHARAFLYADCPPRVADEAIRRLRPTGLETDGDVADLQVGWTSSASSYVVCTADAVVHPDDQRRVAARTGRTRELAASHSPMLSRPDDLADVIAEEWCAVLASDPLAR